MLFSRQYLAPTSWPLLVYCASGIYWHASWSWVGVVICVELAVLLVGGYWQHILNASIDEEFENFVVRAESSDAQLQEIPWPEIFGMISTAFQRFFSASNEVPITLASAARARVRVFVYRPLSGRPMPTAELAFMSFLRTAYIILADDPRTGGSFTRFKLFHELAHVTPLSGTVRTRRFLVPTIAGCFALCATFSAALSWWSVTFLIWAAGAAFSVIKRSRVECEAVADAIALGMFGSNEERTEVAHSALEGLEKKLQAFDSEALKEIRATDASWGRVSELELSKLLVFERVRLFQKALASPDLFYPRTPYMKGWTLPGLAWLGIGLISAYFAGASMQNPRSLLIGFLVCSLVAAKLQSWGPLANQNRLDRKRGAALDARINAVASEEDAAAPEGSGRNEARAKPTEVGEPPT